jgi:hypothetical protein
MGQGGEAAKSEEIWACLGREYHIPGRVKIFVQKFLAA